MSENKKYELLQTPFNIGSVQIKNRFVMGPMGMSWLNAKDGSFNDEAIAYFETRAKGGFGAIITGVTLADRLVDPSMSDFGSFLDNKEPFIAAGKRLNSVCNAYDTKIIFEIGFGVGRNYPTFKSPSASPAFAYPTMISTPLTRKEIHLKRDQVVEGAVVAKEAGFAGVDIHTLHWGYLLDQFVLSITNQRTDEYGGSLENRLRLLRETVEGIQSNCGKDFPITVGLGVKSFIKGLNKASLTGEDEAGRTVEESIRIAKMLEEMGIAAILTDVGVYDSFYYACPPSYMPKGHAVDLYKPIKDAVHIPVIARSRLGNADICLDTVSSGKADAVILSRPSLADPEFPNKVFAGKPEEIRPCIGCNMGCIGRVVESDGTGERPSCAANPRACYEYLMPPKKAASPKSIAVVGGGVGGMQACLTAVECGHKVELFEKEDHLGGELNSAGAHDFKQDIHHLRDWFIAQLKKNEVPVHLSTEFTADMAKDGKYDVVIVASGASPVMPASIPGIEKAMSCVDLLENDREVGDSVIIVGGGMVGCETAVDLAKKGKKVSLVEALPDVLSSEFVPEQHKMMLHDMLEHYGVEIYRGYKLKEVTDNGAIIEGARKMFTLNQRGAVSSNIDEGEIKELKADNVVMAIGLKPNEKVTAQLEKMGVKAIEIGSAVKAGNVIQATKSAFHAVYNLD